MPTRIVLIFIFSLVMTRGGLSADQDTVLVSRDYEGVSLETVMNDLENCTGSRFFYKKEWITDHSVSLSFQDVPLRQALKEIFPGTGLTCLEYQPGIFVLVKAGKRDQSTEILYVLPSTGKYRISGKVMNAETNRPVVGANIYIEDLNIGAATGLDGTFFIELPSGNYTVQISSLGLEKTVRQVNLTRDTEMVVSLFTESVELDEIVIRERAPDENVTGTQIGTSKISMKTIDVLPSVLGEHDVVQNILLLPGVTNVGEGTSGFNVRGGKSDQNLILMDGIPVFNSSHLFGFFSTFNPDVVRDVTLYRGGIPARYGGRLSSILAVEQREGDLTEFSGKATAGLIASRLTLEGPVIRNRSSFLLSGRTSYTKWLLGRFPNDELRNSHACYYDANGKIRYRINENNRLYLSAYLSHDGFEFQNKLEDLLYEWGTRTGIARWNHIFTERFFSDLYLSYGNSYQSYSTGEEADASTLNTGLQFEGIRNNYQFNRLENHRISFGAETYLYHYNNGELVPSHPESAIVPFSLQGEQSLESAVFAGDEIDLTGRISVMAGLRYSFFFNLGPGDVYLYEDPGCRTPETVSGTGHYSPGDVIRFYHGLEPRFSVKFGLDRHSSLKLGYNRMKQYIHQISNTSAMSPVDQWKTSNKYIPPETGDQYSIGYFRNFKSNMYETSVEIYYKNLQDIIEYRDQAKLLMNEKLEADLLNGYGRSYGLELFLKKVTGSLTGWISYTYSRVEFKVYGEKLSQQVNFGEFYPARYDKPHDLTLVANYQFNKKWSISANFVYRSGSPITVPVSQYSIEENIVLDYSNRNQYRIPDYHRLDISINFRGKKYKRKEIFSGDLSLSVYNLYSRDNIYSVFFRKTYGIIPQPFKLSVIGAAIPSVSYSLKF